jgi:hypothetical protein
MPSKSQTQRRFLEHKFGHKWVKKHHFNKVKKGGRKK